MVAERFRHVWYRYDGKKGFGLLIMKDVGTLVVNDEGMSYAGRRHQVHIPKASVTGIDYGPQGKDTMNQWIRIEYTDEETGVASVALFTDGRLLGWMEAFGGNLRILNAIAKVWTLNYDPRKRGMSCLGCWIA